jgi:hypothetical protein
MKLMLQPLACSTCCQAIRDAHAIQLLLLLLLLLLLRAGGVTGASSRVRMQAMSPQGRPLSCTAWPLLQ